MRMIIFNTVAQAITDRLVIAINYIGTRARLGANPHALSLSRQG